MNRCFVTIFDRHYYEYGAVLIQSLADNYKKPLDVVCLVTEELDRQHWQDKFVNALSGARHLNIKFKSLKEHKDVLDRQDWTANLPEYVTSTAMYKLLIPAGCTEYDEVAYADADCLFVRDATKFIEHPLHAEAKIIALSENSIAAERDLGEPERAYFNNGVFVADLNYWRDQKVGDRCFDWLETNDAGQYAEQTAMNVILHDVWFPLSGNFNYWDEFSYCLKNSYPNPVLVHFLGHLKPWLRDEHLDPNRGVHNELWCEVYDKVWGRENLGKR